MEHLCHVLGVGHADAEPECPHRADVRHLVAQLREHDGSPGVVAREDVRELALVVASPGPGDAAQIGPVGDDEVVERAEQVGAERIPQAQLGRRAAVEEGAYVDPVGPLGRRGEAQSSRG